MGQKSDYLLSSRHDPLTIGMGEGGMINDTDDGTSSSSGSPLKRRVRKHAKESHPEGIAAVIKSVIDLCNDNSKSVEKNSTGKAGLVKDVCAVVLTENLPLTDLYIMIDQHKSHMNFLKEHDMLTDTKKSEIVGKISHVFEIIEGRSERKRKSLDVINDESRRVS